MKKPWVFTLPVPLYPVRVRMGVGDSFAQMAKQFAMFGDAVTELVDDDDSHAAVVSRGQEFAILFTVTGLNHEIVAHEIFHLTHRIMRALGDEFPERTNEPYAYLCGRLTKFVYDRLKKKKVVVE